MSDDYEGVRLTARFLREIYDLELVDPNYISLVSIYNELSDEVFDRELLPWEKSKTFVVTPREFVRTKLVIDIFNYWI